MGDRDRTPPRTPPRTPAGEPEFPSCAVFTSSPFSDATSTSARAFGSCVRHHARRPEAVEGAAAPGVAPASLLSLRATHEPDPPAPNTLAPADEDNNGDEREDDGQQQGQQGGEASALEELLALPELREAVLRFLPLCDLCRGRRISRDFRGWCGALLPSLPTVTVFCNKDVDYSGLDYATRLEPQTLRSAPRPPLSRSATLFTPRFGHYAVRHLSLPCAPQVAGRWRRRRLARGRGGAAAPPRPRGGRLRAARRPALRPPRLHPLRPARPSSGQA